MKKQLILIGILMVLLVTSVSAYSTIITMTVSSMSCDYCTNGVGLTGVTGQTNGRTVCISTTKLCTCDITGTSVITGNNIAEGAVYTTGSGTLSSETNYYGCVKLQERDYGAGNGYSMNPLSSCTGSTASRWAFTIQGTATCGGYAYKQAGSTTVQDSLIFYVPIVG